MLLVQEEDREPDQGELRVQVHTASQAETPEPRVGERAQDRRRAEVLARVSRGLKDAMPGIEISTLAPAEMLQGRGW